MNGRGEKRITIAVLDDQSRLVDLRRDVPESQVGEKDVVVSADIDLPLDSTYWWDAEGRCFWPWRGPPMTKAEREMHEALRLDAPTFDERKGDIDCWEDLDDYSKRKGRAVERAVKREREFAEKTTENATKENVEKGEENADIVIKAVKKILQVDSNFTYRHKNGKVNVSKLANFYVQSDTTNSPVRYDRARQIIRAAIERGNLA